MPLTISTASILNFDTPVVNRSTHRLDMVRCQLLSDG